MERIFTGLTGLLAAAGLALTCGAAAISHNSDVHAGYESNYIRSHITSVTANLTVPKVNVLGYTNRHAGFAVEDNDEKIRLMSTASRPVLMPTASAVTPAITPVHKPVSSSAKPDSSW